VSAAIVKKGHQLHTSILLARALPLGPGTDFHGCWPLVLREAHLSYRSARRFVTRSACVAQDEDDPISPICVTPLDTAAHVDVCSTRRGEGACHDQHSTTCFSWSSRSAFCWSHVSQHVGIAGRQCDAPMSAAAALGVAGLVRMNAVPRNANRGLRVNPRSFARNWSKPNDRSKLTNQEINDYCGYQHGGSSRRSAPPRLAIRFMHSQRSVGRITSSNKPPAIHGDKAPYLAIREPCKSSGWTIVQPKYDTAVKGDPKNSTICGGRWLLSL